MSDQESINILSSLVPPLNLNGEDTASKVQQVPKVSPGPAAPLPLSSGCPFLNGSGAGRQNFARNASNNSQASQASNTSRPGLTRNPEWQTSISVASEEIPYTDYLCLDKVLNAQFPLSQKYGKLAHDEHLFIIVHQAYELWFKQIIFEMDSIMSLLGKPVVDESNLLVIVSRFQRINLIWKLLIDQIAILETMAPTDFIDFRGYLTTASGFQSLQFRLFENKLGLPESLRIKYNQQNYDYVFTDEESRQSLRKTFEHPTLLKLIEAWLERTPGLVSIDYNECGNKIEYNFMLKEYEKAVHKYLNDTFVTPAMEEPNDLIRKGLLDEYKKTMDSFSTLFDKEKHDKLVERGERKLSHKAIWGALMIWLNRDEPRFHLPYQLLSLLTDLDALINRWRYNHALLAQRQVGNKSGTGGSSGYSYLRSTASDRYKMFNDIVNLSTWLIPRDYVPKLNAELRKRLNSFNE